MAFMKITALIFCAVVSDVQGAVGSHGRLAGRSHNRFHAKGNSMIAKIIQMLEEEKDKIGKDIEKESKDMEEYMQYCDDDQSEKAYAIKTATKKIDELSALIADNTAQITAFEEEIAELAAEMAERQEEVDKADKLRAQQHAEFLKREEQQNIMVAELEKMSIELKHQMAAMTTPPPVPVEGEEFTQEDDDDASLLQRDHSKLRAKSNAVSSQKVLTQDMLQGVDMNEMRRVMTQTVNLLFKDPLVSNVEASRKGTGFIQQPIDPLAGLGQSAGGENSGPVQVDETVSPEENLKAFEGLKKKAEKALQEEREGESNAQQAHMMNKQSLSDQINLCKYKQEEAQKEKSKLSEEKAEAEGELAETKETMAADNKYLTQLVTQCTDGAKAWDARQQEAKAEMAAINKAKEILASRVTVLVQRVQTTRKVSPDGVTPLDLQAAKLRQTLMNHFRNVGNKLKSLSMLNLVSVSSAQPFDKIKGLISDLIAKLEKEAAEAADTHAFCEEEKKKNEEGLTRTTDKITDLEARLDKASAKKAGLASDIEELSDEIAEIDKAQAEATKIREEEHATFVKAEADFSEAADAVSDAIDALNEYYGGGEMLLQTGHKQPAAAPALGGAKKDSSNIIVGMLETMGAEFSKTVAELQATEHEADEAYKKMSQENKVAKTAKDMQIKGSKSEIASLDVTIGHFTEDHKMSSEEKAAILEYVESLKPTCYGRVMSYEERKAKRDAEIEGCKEALQILEESSPTSPAISLLQHGSLRH